MACCGLGPYPCTNIWGSIKLDLLLCSHEWDIGWRRSGVQQQQSGLLHSQATQPSMSGSIKTIAAASKISNADIQTIANYVYLVWLHWQRMSIQIVRHWHDHEDKVFVESSRWKLTYNTLDQWGSTIAVALKQCWPTFAFTDGLPKQSSLKSLCFPID